jgi:hypothetical protein
VEPFLVSAAATQFQRKLGKELSFPEGVVRKLIKLREALGYLENKLESKQK